MKRPTWQPWPCRQNRATNQSIYQSINQSITFGPSGEHVAQVHDPVRGVGVGYGGAPPLPELELGEALGPGGQPRGALPGVADEAGPQGGAPPAAAAAPSRLPRGGGGGGGGWPAARVSGHASVSGVYWSS